MYYVYVLKSERDTRFYTGFTIDLKNRISEHNAGRVRSTALRRPLKLVYYEACLNQADAIHREKYLKTNRLRVCLLFNFGADKPEIVIRIY